MGLAHIHRRLKRLSAAIRPGACRQFALEPLCRAYWRMDPHGFRTLVSRECSLYRVLVDSFEREDADSLGRPYQFDGETQNRRS
jgi:hypothetical protein